MRTKLMIGLFGMAIVAFFAGDYLFNRSSSQEPSSGKQLFDLLKKELDAKKDVVLPALPGQQQDSKDPAVVPASNSVAFPQPAEPKSTSAVPPVYVPQVDAPAPMPVQKPMPMPVPVSDVRPQPTVPPSNNTPAQGARPAPEHSVWNPPAQTSSPPPLSPTKPMVSSSPPFTPAEARPQDPKPGARDGVQYQLVVPANPKASPWSFQVDVVDNQTIVTATVNKKHAFKLVCKHLDLQTEIGTLKAKGNVQITGDALEGTCASLSIPLTDDRLVLEGSAEVRIRKTSMSVSYASEVRPAQFELKGETLNLRISDLQSGKYLQTSMVGQRLIAEPGPSNAPLTMKSAAGANWSPYGKLRQTKEMHGEQAVWCLENNNGQPICRFVTRDGGSLNQYIGQTIGVHLEPIENGMSRVTHIALP